jgi:hypothetical protein
VYSIDNPELLDARLDVKSLTPDAEQFLDDFVDAVFFQKGLNISRC